MKNMKKIVALAMAAAMTATLAACGSSSGSSSSSASSSAPAAESTAAAETTQTNVDPAVEASTDATATTESAAADAQTPDLSSDKYVGDGVWTVGTNATFPPFEYIDDNGQPTGFDVALVQEIGKRLGLKVEVQDMEFDALVASIGSKIDAAAAGMTVTDERKKTVDFSEAYYDATQAVLVKKGSSIKTQDDLKNAKVGVQLGTTGAGIADDLHGEGSDKTVTYNSYNDVVQDLINGKTDAVIMDQVPAEAYQSQSGDQLEVLPGTQFNFDTEEYAIALPKGDTELLDAVNGAIDAMKADGTFDSLVDKWINNYSAE